MDSKEANEDEKPVVAARPKERSYDWLPWAVLGGLVSMGLLGPFILIPMTASGAKGAAKAPSASVPPAPSAATPRPSTVPAPAAANPTEKSPEKRGGFKVRQLLVQYKDAWMAPDAVEMTKEAAEKRANEALAKLKAGGDWSAVLARYGNNPETRKNDGDLGIVQEGKTSHFIADAVFALKPGELSGVVPSPFGFHVFKRDGE